jgi:hypothetical protein
MPMARYERMAQLVIGIVVVALVAGRTSAGASTWSPAIGAASHGQGQGGGLPGTPTGVSATCVAANQQKITISWAASAHATSYTVYDSTTSATGTYTALASGIATTSWTSGTLTAGNYWFKIVAQAGTNWVSAKSTATAQRTIASGSCT